MSEKHEMFKYDFGLSFAGENRDIAKQLFQLLTEEDGVTVFYDEDQQAELWGKDLFQEFQRIYRDECRFFIPIISENYILKRWSNHELKQAQARDFKSNQEYILPLRLDDTQLPGLNETTGYIDLRNTSIEEVSRICLEKLAEKSAVRKLYLFLRERNPLALQQLANGEIVMPIRVALADIAVLNRLLQDIGSDFCTGRDHHNTIMNGGFGSGIPSTSPEPHTNFTLNFTDSFLRAVHLSE